MHTLHLAISESDEHLDVGAEAERLVHVLRYFGYHFSAGQSLRSIRGGLATVWTDVHREVAIRLQDRDGGSLLVLSGGSSAACEELLDAIADRLPVVPLDSGHDRIGVPWATGRKETTPPGRMARGSSVNIRLPTALRDDGTDLD